ncbi:organic solute transporter subunit alpha-like isoform X2 [Branchiostoma floridae]|uniref:Organic solute transporter subunit alpha-like isoform X2 n=1 Tax=Branchiostoma floridae TaxID=7739 RepID=A0A9J7KUZ1_BRAFL|nr:organic solute transporter subunit alpha-like isoform X2 [Branchiostoma floridae]
MCDQSSTLPNQTKTPQTIGTQPDVTFLGYARLSTIWSCDKDRGYLKQGSLVHELSRDNMANCSDEVPFSADILALAGRDLTVRALLSTATVCFALTFGLYAEECYSLNKRVPDPLRRNKLLIVLGLFPMFSMTSLVTLWVPRASLYSNFLSTGYLSVSMLVFFSLLTDYHGGKKLLLEEMSETDIKFNTPPCCCCCLCIPKSKLTRKGYGHLRILVLQYTIVRPLLEYIGDVAGADGTLNDAQISVQGAFVWLTILRLLSTLVCMYGCMVIYQNVREMEKFQHVNIRPKFMIVQLVLLISNMQTALLSILSTAGAIPCNPDTLFPVRSRANALNHLLVVFEMLLLGLLARRLYLQEYATLQRGGNHTPTATEGVTNPAMEAENGEVQTDDVKAQGSGV